MNTRSNEAKIMDGKSARELTPEEKYAKIFTKKEQEDFKKNGHSVIVIINPKAGIKTYTNEET